MSHRKRSQSRMAWSLFLVAGVCLLLAGCNTFWFAKEEPPRYSTVNEYMQNTERIPWDGGASTIRLP